MGLDRGRVAGPATLPAGWSGRSLRPGHPAVVRDIRAYSTAIELDLAYSDITDESLAPLLDRFDLRELDVTFTKVSRTMADKLNYALPNCKIRSTWHGQIPRRQGGRAGVGR